MAPGKSAFMPSYPLLFSLLATQCTLCAAFVVLASVLLFKAYVSCHFITVLRATILTNLSSFYLGTCILGIIKKSRFVFVTIRIYALLPNYLLLNFCVLPWLHATWCMHKCDISPRIYKIECGSRKSYVPWCILLRIFLIKFHTYIVFIIKEWRAISNE